MNSRISKRELGFGLAAALFLLAVIPGLNAFTPETSPFHVSDFSINLWGQYLCLSIVAVSIDLLWGYTGLISLGQMLFFSLGGYALGMHLMLMMDLAVSSGRWLNQSWALRAYSGLVCSS